MTDNPLTPLFLAMIDVESEALSFQKSMKATIKGFEQCKPSPGFRYMSPEQRKDISECCLPGQEFFVKWIDSFRADREDLRLTIEHAKNTLACNSSWVNQERGATGSISPESIMSALQKLGHSCPRETAIVWFTLPDQQGIEKLLRSQQKITLFVDQLKAMHELSQRAPQCVSEQKNEQDSSGLVSEARFPKNRFAIDGELTTVAFAGIEKSMQIGVGCHHLGLLLLRAGEAIAVEELIGAESAGSSDRVLDDDARRDYKQELQVLAADRSNTDESDVEAHQGIDRQVEQIRQAFKGAGRAGKRKLDQRRDSIHSTVKSAIRRTLGRIERLFPEFREHLGKRLIHPYGLRPQYTGQAGSWVVEGLYVQHRTEALEGREHELVQTGRP